MIANLWFTSRCCSRSVIGSPRRVWRTQRVTNVRQFHTQRGLCNVDNRRIERRVTDSQIARNPLFLGGFLVGARGLASDLERGSQISEHVTRAPNPSIPNEKRASKLSQVGPGIHTLTPGKGATPYSGSSPSEKATPKFLNITANRASSSEHGSARSEDADQTRDLRLTAFNASKHCRVGRGASLLRTRPTTRNTFLPLHNNRGGGVPRILSNPDWREQLADSTHAPAN